MIRRLSHVQQSDKISSTFVSRSNGSKSLCLSPDVFSDLVVKINRCLGRNAALWLVASVVCGQRHPTRLVVSGLFLGGRYCFLSLEEKLNCEGRL